MYVKYKMQKIPNYTITYHSQGNIKYNEYVFEEEHSLQEINFF